MGETLKDFLSRRIAELEAELGLFSTPGMCREDGAAIAGQLEFAKEASEFLGGQS